MGGSQSRARGSLVSCTVCFVPLLFPSGAPLRNHCHPCIWFMIFRFFLQEGRTGSKAILMLAKRFFQALGDHFKSLRLFSGWIALLWFQIYGYTSPVGTAASAVSGWSISLSRSVYRQLRKVCFSCVLNLCFGVIRLMRVPHPSLKSLLSPASCLLFLWHKLCRILECSILKLYTTLVFKSRNLN